MSWKKGMGTQRPIQVWRIINTWNLHGSLIWKHFFFCCFLLSKQSALFMVFFLFFFVFFFFNLKRFSFFHSKNCVEWIWNWSISYFVPITSSESLIFSLIRWKSSYVPRPSAVFFHFCNSENRTKQMSEFSILNSQQDQSVIVLHEMHAHPLRHP